MSEEVKDETLKEEAEATAETSEEVEPEATEALEAETEEAAKAAIPTAEEEIELLKEKIRELEDQKIRQIAEVENFKKRSLSDMQARIKYAAQGLIVDLLAGFDNLERAIGAAAEQAKQNEELAGFIDGMEMVKKGFLEALERHNVKRIEPFGEPFDPNMHEAMGMIESEEVEPDHVAAVFQAGYQLHDRVVRPAMVQVAKK